MSSPDFVPHYALVQREGSVPVAWMLVLHGIFGSGANWRTFARRLSNDCPEWGFVLVDLRGHGLTPHAPPPNTIAAAADDLVRLEALLGEPAQGRPALRITGVSGHSFGGKVALAYLARRSGAPLDQAWVLDANPGARSESPGGDSTARVLGALELMPEQIASREHFIELIEEQGHTHAIAAWLAMNLRREGDGYRFRLDLGALRALLNDYFATDLWPVIERPDPRRARVLHVVVGGRSEVFGPESRARLEAAAVAPLVRAHVLDKAGHWLHVDDFDGLYALFRAELAASPVALGSPAASR
jgi:pimeloyl-ACP methyl ester carboxylesterase